jgi:hypothetical protein
MKNIKIAQGYTVGDWQALDLSSEAYNESWEKAIGIFEIRIRNRFLNPIKTLLQSEIEIDPKEKQNGFSIMAILCLLVESLQCFLEGRSHSKSLSKELFVRFLTENEPFKTKLKFTPHVAGEVFTHFRCGILHQAEITGGARLRSVGPAVREKGGKIILNRTKFANGVFQYFEAYLVRLRGRDESGSKLRGNLKRKFDSIIANSV